MECPKTLVVTYFLFNPISNYVELPRTLCQAIPLIKFVDSKVIYRSLIISLDIGV